jgi:hypothetical protein
VDIELRFIRNPPVKSVEQEERIAAAIDATMEAGVEATADSAEIGIVVAPTWLRQTVV